MKCLKINYEKINLLRKSADNEDEMVCVFLKNENNLNFTKGYLKKYTPISVCIHQNTSWTRHEEITFSWNLTVFILRFRWNHLSENSDKIFKNKLAQHFHPSSLEIQFNSHSSSQHGRASVITAFHIYDQDPLWKTNW